MTEQPGQPAPIVDGLVAQYRQACAELEAFRRERRLREFSLLGRRADALRALVEQVPKRAVGGYLGITGVHVGRMIVEDMERRAALAFDLAGVQCWGVGTYHGGQRVGVVAQHDGMAGAGGRNGVVEAAARCGLRLMWVAGVDQSGAAHCAAAARSVVPDPGMVLVEYVFDRHDQECSPGGERFDPVRPVE